MQNLNLVNKHFKIDKMKPRIFLGSSAENLTTLEIISHELSAVGNCVKWTSAFEQNKSNLDSLFIQTRLSDFSILLAMKDDIVEKKGEKLNVSRDNVIFEFGLFLGSTGINRSFLVAEDGIDLPSDLDGVTIEKFTLEEGKYNSIKNICQNINENIQKQIKSSELGLLPSTALAIGYYNGFVKRVCEDLHHTGKMINGSDEFEVSKFVFKVIIPEELDDNGVDDFKVLYNKKHELSDASTLGKSGIKRGYPLAFKIDLDEDNADTKTHSIIDIPSTLNTIVECIKLYMPHLQIGKNEDIDILEKKELWNFARVLKYLISKNASTKNNVIVIEGESI